VYQDLNDPRGIAVLTMSRDPNVFIDAVRPAVNSGALAGLTFRPEFTMFGRTYALGYEPDLQSVLLERPRNTVLNPAWPWGVWYPLRRNGKFTQLSAEEQRVILAEHGEIGMRFGAADYVHDVRLACHGLDRDDNDFVIGLIGKDLYPLSDIVQVVAGDAFQQIPKVAGTFDFVFLDAWKPDYQRFFEMVFPRLNTRGLFLAHNVVNKQGEMRDFLGTIERHPALATSIVRPGTEGMSVSVKLR